MEAELLCVGDPEKDVREFLQRDIMVKGLQREIKRIEDKLVLIEKEKKTLIAADGENGGMWERKVEAEARAKYRAALLLGEVGMKKLGSASPTATPGPHTASAPAKSGTKREPVSLPNFVGSEKTSNSPFFDFPVWLENWQQHIVD